MRFFKIKILFLKKKLQYLQANTFLLKHFYLMTIRTINRRNLILIDILFLLQCGAFWFLPSKYPLHANATQRNALFRFIFEQFELNDWLTDLQEDFIPQKQNWTELKHIRESKTILISSVLPVIVTWQQPFSVFAQNDKTRVDSSGGRKVRKTFQVKINFWR